MKSIKYTTHSRATTKNATRLSYALMARIASDKRHFNNSYGTHATLPSAATNRPVIVRDLAAKHFPR